MSSFAKVFRSFLGRGRTLRQLHKIKRPNVRHFAVLPAITGSAVLVASLQCVHAKEKEKPPAETLTPRQERFAKFASVEYDGQLYMTPRDFLDSVVESDPRPRLKRKPLTARDLDQIRRGTPRKGSGRYFRDLRHNGIISYIEYCFLLSVLTKPESGFRIAFNMFDTDGNEKVDQREFQVLEKVFCRSRKKLEETSTHSDGLQSHGNGISTTLTLRFFGPKGDASINFEEFRRFMVDLKNEVLELEFGEFSKGFPTITERDFARILLRYTFLNVEAYLDRLEGLEDSKGITFEDFKVFSHFLNNLEDFSQAMKMYILAGHLISKEEFHKAVRICTGADLSPHVVNTVFALFDGDGDGLLGYHEFVEIMKDRLHRKFRMYDAKRKGWVAFKNCLRREMT